MTTSAIYQQMKTETCDFWVGNFKTENAFFDFFGEDEENFYKDSDEDMDDKFISEFARSQGVNWIDHDFMECGFEDSDTEFDKRFKKYSYSKQWIPEVEKRIKDQNLKGINAVAFITAGRIKQPKSVVTESFSLTYIGNIQYEI